MIQENPLLSKVSTEKVTLIRFTEIINSTHQNRPGKGRQITNDPPILPGALFFHKPL